jgi:hypothetical protein
MFLLGNMLFTNDTLSFRILDKNYPLPSNLTCLDESSCKDLSLINSDICKNSLHVKGYWQHGAHLSNIKDDLRRIISLRFKPGMNYMKFLSWVQDPHTAVIHIRRGDFLTNRAFGACNQSYYKSAIEKLISNTKINRVLLFSNDDGSFIKSLNLPVSVTCYPSRANNRSIIEEFFLLKQSRNLIISNSTYSWWAAYLNTEAINILAPNRWAIKKEIDQRMQSLIQPDWLIIPNELELSYN